MQDIRIAIGRLLLVGIIISFIFIVFGGCLYLFQHGSDIANFQHFNGESILLTSFFGILADVFSFSSRGIIQLGLLMLLFVQLLRVALTAWYFLKENDNLFTGISLFILSVLILTSLCSV